MKLDTENHSLNNKVSLLTSDIERAEKSVEEVIQDFNSKSLGQDSIFSF
jgi:hypothetical protein